MCRRCCLFRCIGFCVGEFNIGIYQVVDVVLGGGVPGLGRVFHCVKVLLKVRCYLLVVQLVNNIAEQTAQHLSLCCLACLKSTVTLEYVPQRTVVRQLLVESQLVFQFFDFLCQLVYLVSPLVYILGVGQRQRLQSSYRSLQLSYIVQQFAVLLLLVAYRLYSSPNGLLLHISILQYGIYLVFLALADCLLAFLVVLVPYIHQLLPVLLFQTLLDDVVFFLYLLHLLVILLASNELMLQVKCQMLLLRFPSLVVLLYCLLVCGVLQLFLSLLLVLYHPRSRLHNLPGAVKHVLLGVSFAIWTFGLFIRRNRNIVCY